MRSLAFALLALLPACGVGRGLGLVDSPARPCGEYQMFLAPAPDGYAGWVDWADCSIRISPFVLEDYGDRYLASIVTHEFWHAAGGGHGQGGYSNDAQLPIWPEPPSAAETAFVQGLHGQVVVWVHGTELFDLALNAADLWNEAAGRLLFVVVGLEDPS